MLLKHLLSYPTVDPPSLLSHPTVESPTVDPPHLLSKSMLLQKRGRIGLGGDVGLSQSPNNSYPKIGFKVIIGVCDLPC